MRTGRFAVTAEIAPPRGADVSGLRETARLLRDWVDAANVTDNQGARVRVSSLAGQRRAARRGARAGDADDGRDRNRIALQSDLLAAGALGIPNVLLMTGDRPEHGDHAEATPVFDLDSETRWPPPPARSATTPRCCPGQVVDPPPRYLLGAVDLGAGEPDRLVRKVEERRGVRADPVRVRRAGVRVLAATGA